MNGISVKTRLEEIRYFAYADADEEQATSLERKLFIDILRLAAEGQNVQKEAEEALKVTKWTFKRLLL